MLFGTNTFRKLEKYIQILNITWVLKSSYYHMLDHMLSVTNEAWKKEHSQIVYASKQRGLILSGNGRYDSLGHNAKYHIYWLFDQSFKKFISLSLRQVTEVKGVSNRIEKEGLIKVLDKVQQKNISVDQLTTEWHLQINKYLKGQEEGVY